MFNARSHLDRMVFLDAGYGISMHRGGDCEGDSVVFFMCSSELSFSTTPVPVLHISRVC